MPKRNYPFFKKCRIDGCRKGQNFSYSTRKAYKEAVERNIKFPWYCDEHNPKNNYLTPNSETITDVIEFECVHPDAEKYPSIKDQHTWSTGSSHANSTTTNAKWSADAERFPIGSKVVITTKIEVVLPDIK